MPSANKLGVVLALCIFANSVADAAPSPAGRADALTAVDALCLASSTTNTSLLAKELQSAVTGLVLTCSSPSSRSAFIEAVAEFQPSGYPADATIIPSIVVQPTGTADVAQAVRFAAAHSLVLAVKGGGYSFRNTWIADKGLTIDLSHMKAVKVDAARQEVTVQGGVIYADILAAAQPQGLAVPWGDADQTGLGLALGGGIGYLSRPHGLTADNIINATLVLANGTEVTANASHNADLLAAMRGGGTLFGVVTQLAFRAVDVSDYKGGVITYADDAKCTTFRAAHEWAAEAMAKEQSLGVEVIQAPSPSGHNTVTVQVGMPGSVPVQDRQSIVAPLKDLPGILEDSLDNLTYPAFQQTITAVGDEQLFQSIFYIGAVLTFGQAEAGLLDLMPQLLHDIPANFTYLFLADYLGNTVSENAVKNTSSFTPFGGDIDFHFFVKYQWPAGVDDEANSAFAQERINLIAPYVTTTQPYYNLATVTNNATLESQVGGASNLAELRRLKSQLDPTNLFSRHGFVGL